MDERGINWLYDQGFTETFNKIWYTGPVVVRDTPQAIWSSYKSNTILYTCLSVFSRDKKMKTKREELINGKWIEPRWKEDDRTQHKPPRKFRPRSATHDGSGKRAESCALLVSHKTRNALKCRIPSSGLVVCSANKSRRSISALFSFYNTACVPGGCYV